MHPRALVAVIVAIGSTAEAAPAAAPVGALAPIDRVVAVANGTPVWESQVDEALAHQPAEGTSAARAEQRRQVLERLIDDALILRLAHKMYVEATDAEVDAGIAEVKAQNHLDDAGFAAALAQYGTTLPRYREDLRQQIIELRTFHQAAMPPPGTPADKLAVLRDAWIGELHRTARIERR